MMENGNANIIHNQKDRKIVRELAAKYHNIAMSGENIEKARLFRAVNDRKMIRPVVLIDELPWFELNIDNCLDCVCEDQGLRGLEWHFRYWLARHKYFGCDLYLNPVFTVAKNVKFSGIGMWSEEKILKTDERNGIVAHQYADKLQTEEDLEKLHNETVTYNEEGTKKYFEYVSDIIGDIMPVKIGGLSSDYGLGHGIWDTVSTLKGVESLLTDLAERPEFMHKIARKLTDIFLDKLRQLEEQNLLGVDQTYIHCTPALTDDLERPDDFDHIKPHNMWGRAVAQIFGSVSKAMHDEFDITYAVESMKQFGMTYYGCCEPLDKKIDILKKIKNLRKISITPWADINLAAEVMGSEFVVASKPNPANVGTGFDEDVIRKELKTIVDAVKRNNCSCDIVLKDISTVAGKPDHLLKWAQIAMETVNNY
ncbi:MAG: hypothetical protein FWD71_13945 [Oscillospiraceae bacterium]|nr:hypothetical protein [Oscillospiraceae bacterium]